jgi:hypothetical protein
VVGLSATASEMCIEARRYEQLRGWEDDSWRLERTTRTKRMDGIYSFVLRYITQYLDLECLVLHLESEALWGAAMSSLHPFALIITNHLSI